MRATCATSNSDRYVCSSRWNEPIPTLMITRRVPILLALIALPCVLPAQRQPGHPIGKVVDHRQPDSPRARQRRRRARASVRSRPSNAAIHARRRRLSRRECRRWCGTPTSGPRSPAARRRSKNFTFPFSGKEVGHAQRRDGIDHLRRDAKRSGRRPRRRRSCRQSHRRRRIGARADSRWSAMPSLQTVGRTFINMIPGIAAFDQVAGSASVQRYVKELADRAVVTWTLSEPSGGIQAFTWVPTVNRIQAVLHKDGVDRTLIQRRLGARRDRRRLSDRSRRASRSARHGAPTDEDDERRRQPRREEGHALGDRRPLSQSHDRDARRRCFPTVIRASTA